MRSTALAYKDEEVFMSSTELLEANVASMRIELTDLKTDFRAAMARIDAEIKGAVTELRGEIRAMAAKAEKDLQQFVDRTETQLRELRADNKLLREKMDNGFERLFTRFDSDIRETHKALIELTKAVVRVDNRQAALLWVGGGLVALITLAITVGKALKWF